MLVKEPLIYLFNKELIQLCIYLRENFGIFVECANCAIVTKSLSTQVKTLDL